jgi:hypothetical protein
MAPDVTAQAAECFLPAEKVRYRRNFKQRESV